MSAPGAIPTPQPASLAHARFWVVVRRRCLIAAAQPPACGNEMVQDRLNKDPDLGCLRLPASANPLSTSTSATTCAGYRRNSKPGNRENAVA